jgi:hypothetical protein
MIRRAPPSITTVARTVGVAPAGSAGATADDAEAGG